MSGGSNLTALVGGKGCDDEGIAEKLLGLGCSRAGPRRGLLPVNLSLFSSGFNRTRDRYLLARFHPA
jgi:hypothetical protein